MVEFSELEPTGAQSGDFGDAAAYLNRGLDHLFKEEHTLAIADFSAAIALNPGDAIAYNRRGNAYIDIGEADLAIADFSQAIALDPDFAFAYYCRGNAYLDIGETDLAIADLTQAIALAPDDFVRTPTGALPMKLKGSTTWRLPTTARPLP